MSRAACLFPRILAATALIGLAAHASPAWTAATRNCGLLVLLSAYAGRNAESSLLVHASQLLYQPALSDPCIHGRVAELLELSGDYGRAAVEWAKYDDRCRPLEELAASYATSGDWGNAMASWDRAASAASGFDHGLVVSPQHPVHTNATSFSLVKPDGLFQRDVDRITLFTNRAVAQAFTFPSTGQYCLSIQVLNSRPGPVLIEALLGLDRLGIARFSCEDNLWGEHSWQVQVGKPGRYLLTLLYLNDEVTGLGDRNAELGSVAWRACGSTD